jgi:hypothetical protein
MGKYLDFNSEQSITFYSLKYLAELPDNFEHCATAVYFWETLLSVRSTHRAEAKWAPQGGAGASGGLQRKEYDQARRHQAQHI